MKKHITVVVAASATGVLTPPFLIFAGKRKGSEWHAPVSWKFKEPPSGIKESFTKPKWFPENSCITVTDNGSMEGPVFTAFVQHLDFNARQHLYEEGAFLFFLNRHSSRMNPDWMNYCST